ncbi:unnamed protein product [Peronospora destructor]|uniref:KH domain-containing protein n=1 Tax=Peronospora destructor TaxID=86335 RepID=A0AAV0UWK5_9STRA|nr:unnamed protein product [Peronospora destructor]
MSNPVEVICDDDEVCTDSCSPLHRRHTLRWKFVTGFSVGLCPNFVEGGDAHKPSIDTCIESKNGRRRRRHGDKVAFTLHDVDAFSVQRAKVIRRVSEKRYIRFRNFFISNESEMAMEIQARSAFSLQHLDAWVNYIVNPTVLHCIVGRRGTTQQELLDLLMVSAAISKYGESKLMAKDRRGELHALQNVELCDESLQMRQQTESEQTDSNSVLMEFVHYERRCHQEQTKQQASVYKEEERFKQIVVRVQSKWFQDTMLKVKGRYLYDAIRQVFRNANNSLWDESKDKPELSRERVQRRDQPGAEVMQVERRAASDRQTRPRPPPPPPPLLAAVTKNSSTSKHSFNKVLLVPSPPNASTKAGFTVYNRFSSLPADEVHERESTIIVGTNKTCRRPQPLGATRIPQPRGLIPKRPQSIEIDPIVRAPSAFIITARIK